MDSPSTIPAIGTKLLVTELRDTRGFLVQPKHMSVRRAGETVTMKGWVPGHGGDVWWCKHDNGDVGAYCFTELEFAEPSA